LAFLSAADRCSLYRPDSLRDALLHLVPAHLARLRSLPANSCRPLALLESLSLVCLTVYWLVSPALSASYGLARAPLLLALSGLGSSPGRCGHHSGLPLLPPAKSASRAPPGQTRGREAAVEAGTTAKPSAGLVHPQAASSDGPPARGDARGQARQQAARRCGRRVRVSFLPVQDAKDASYGTAPRNAAV
ncbi:hypothetical protein KI387_023917, partial [Taxus chinensis]